ncbi:MULTISPECIES: alcohol dehydrogenase catalytic domain-containing protein [unclassified Mesorhizobium]|uniref:zinc-dependent alcohol dehydrogenase n=5 Tax=Mesorhizobium TaxID=68287 RepID=UPI000F7619F1|nr:MULTISPECIES: alcohol dehydrogenase catalytic domain-containing protein [unclassified Mesorhizobium]AZO06786.1 dehydrogenase [Mesorhizobium sp. M2A.F.Ca.ET.043.02.1.1]RUW41214.1 dehydrogenase [Mesorhizobium sp. M2A.F.Ca.ET.015.02.1.1]RUW63631.1 dehydrogenase [Mesorhizobium sp. M2A.F.Ca.ET.067.02.1.1]RVC94418.1 dehydrogenase [Mesorhizobium sp. M2A.F.Ca.ET.017.03.2.1]RVD09604.1 dehydrogenase [Mesorhizobium sp. M2A.F.Ca.ET.029.05.1.1]
MKAARLHGPGDLRVENIAAPGPPEPGWVKLNVDAAGICGSDLHNFRTGQWISRAPSTAGHELTGTVVAVGEGVGTVAVGDRVVADSRFWCGECAQCRAGRRHLCASLGFVGEVCDGGFAEQTVLPARLLHLIDAALDERVAAMAEPLAVALHAVRRLPKTAGSVLVVGCGTIGGLAALLLSRTLPGRVLIADRNKARCERVARVTGATIVDLDREAIAEATADAPLLAAVEATGSIAALNQLLGVLGSGATVALVGIFHGRLDIDPNMLVEREIGLLGCHAFADELPDAIGMLAELSGPLISLIDREIGLDDIPAAYERLLAGQGDGLKTIIRLRQPAGT